MLSFHNDEKIKQKYIDRLKWHMQQDNIVQRVPFKNGKGCAVGCTLESYNHKAYETELGLPEWLAHLEDKIHEGLSLEDAKKWPLEFLEAIPVGVDANLIKNDFFVIILKRILENIGNLSCPQEILTKVTKAVEGVIAALQGAGDLDEAYTDANDAARAAYDAANESYGAASFAASAAAYAATDAYITADDSYAEAAAAYAAAYAANYAAADAYARARARAAYSAGDEILQKEFYQQSRDLLKLLIDLKSN